MLDLRRIHSLTDFLRNHREHVARLRETGGPKVLTINGKAALVLQDADSYQGLLDRLREMEDLAAIREGLAQADRGDGRPAEEVFAELRRRLADESWEESLDSVGLPAGVSLSDEATSRESLYD
jgi:PHD/YefM family antitoxin component YafN of YafNO toxin-antitoxin module